MIDPWGTPETTVCCGFSLYLAFCCVVIDFKLYACLKLFLLVSKKSTNLNLPTFDFDMLILLKILLKALEE